MTNTQNDENKGRTHSNSRGSGKMRLIILFSTVMLAVLSLGAYGSTGSPSQGAASDTTAAAITFSNNQGDLVDVPATGGRQSILVRHQPGDPEEDYFEPAWSRTGRLAATVVDYPSEGNAWSTVSVLLRKPRLDVPAGDDQASWSPDGRLVLEAAQYGDPYRIGHLFIGWPGGKSAQTLTDGKNGFGSGPYDRMPAWSPDGSLIAFARSATGGPPLHLFVIQPNRRNLRQLTTTFADNPSWSPDSKRLVFDDGHRISVIDVTGRNLRQLSDGPGDTNPAWSPDGHTIAFIRQGNLWTMNVSDRRTQKIAVGVSDPAWKPR